MRWQKSGRRFMKKISWIVLGKKVLLHWKSSIVTKEKIVLVLLVRLNFWEPSTFRGLVKLTARKFLTCCWEGGLLAARKSDSVKAAALITHPGRRFCLVSVFSFSISFLFFFLVGFKWIKTVTIELSSRIKGLVWTIWLKTVQRRITDVSRYVLTAVKES